MVRIKQLTLLTFFLLVSLLIANQRNKTMFKAALRTFTLRTPALQFVRFQSTIKQLNTLPELQSAISSKQLSVVDFYATWCGPCKAIAPQLEKMNTEYENVNFYKVDVDESPEVAGYCGVSAMPTFIMFKDGKGLGKIVGADPRGLKQGIEDFKN